MFESFRLGYKTALILGKSIEEPSVLIWKKLLPEENIFQTWPMDIFTG